MIGKFRGLPGEILIWKDFCLLRDIHSLSTYTTDACLLMLIEMGYVEVRNLEGDEPDCVLTKKIEEFYPLLNI